MKKFLTVLCLCFVSIDVSAATYSCKPQSKPARDAATLELLNGKYLICGHQGTDGCNDGAVVYSDKEEAFYKCDSSGRNKWIKMSKSEVPTLTLWARRKDIFNCYGERCGVFFDSGYVVNSERLSNGGENYGFLNHEIHAELCVSGGGIYDKKTGCFCDQDHGLVDDDWLEECICKDGLEYNEYDKKCYPKGSKVENKPAEQNVENQPAKQETIEEPVEEVVDNKTGTKTTVKYNYQQCEKDNDCKNVDNTVRPYLHSTAWHCAWQSAGVRVCTATACESGWTPINGYCQEDKNTQTPQSENKNANSVSNIKTETKAGTKKPCTDLANMDSNCKCIVVGTVERGGKCVCRDDNQEIKNGKCEWTEKYVAGLESDLDSKFNGLSATIGGFEKNVWRDENGEFNTARLASDSIAGVVLGTVGGIVTANLVKKAQVKQGFEDIGCYIGGQSVAGYGDEFNVGR